MHIFLSTRQLSINMEMTPNIDLPNLNYQQLGEGQDIILIHGLFGSLENLNMVAKVLSQFYKVTSIDVRNHGSSFHHNGMGYPQLALDVFRLLDFLSIQTCCLLGHSMGGKIAIQMALESTKVSCPITIEKMIVADISPVPYPPHHERIIQGLKSIDLSKVKSRKDADIQLAEYVDNLGVRQFLLRNLQSNEHSQFSFKCDIDNIKNGYDQIMQGISLNSSEVDDNREQTTPYQGNVLFIKGGQSDYILPEHKAAISAILPNSKAKIIQGAGHWLHAEKTVAFNKIVLEFLEG